MLDPRQHAFRDDLADQRLKGQVTAARFVEARPFQVTAASLPMRARPHETAALSSELIHGERVDSFEEKDGWAFVQNRADGYVGYVPAGGLGEAGPAPTHRVAALFAPLRAAPAVKSPVLNTLPIHASVAVRDGAAGDWLEIASGGYAHRRHLAPLPHCAPDWVGAALRFLGAPYVWGGRTSWGLDCSALVQLALAAAGIDCPRDSDQQQALGTPVGEGETLRRGDLVFFPGHVGIMVNARDMVHANATRMAVTIDPRETVIGWAGGNHGARRLRLPS